MERPESGDLRAWGPTARLSWLSETHFARLGFARSAGSRAALMTGRQFARVGVPGVFMPTVGFGRIVALCYRAST